MKKNKTTFLGGLFLMVCFLAVTVSSYAQGQQEFTTNVYSTGTSDAQTGPTSTWTVPPGVNTISIIAIGGGGGGGAVHSAFAGSGTTGAAGGGGGAYVRVNNYTVNPGDVLTIHVGSKGSGENSQDSYHPGWGGDSWVKIGSTTIALAKGASDVADKTFDVPGTGGQASQCIGDVKISGGNGGTGSTGAWCGTGGGGAAGGGNGGNGSGPTWGGFLNLDRTDHPGAAGTTSQLYAGNGGAGVVSHAGGTNGKNGSNYGGGGSGSATGVGWASVRGGDGAPGYVLITYSVSCDATPGSIALSSWECTATDTAIVISSSADATSTGSGTYKWQYSTDNSTWSDISGANAASYTAKNTGYYRRGYVVDNCVPVFTNYSVQVTRPSDIDAGTIKDGDNNTEKAICAGDAVNITLTKTYSGNVQWQTSTDKVNWTNDGTGAIYSITSAPTTTTYVRYLAKYSPTCDIPSNTIYTLTVNTLPVVNSFANPTNLCPGESSYEVIANITSSAAITTYTWTGVTSNTDATAQIVPSAYECNHTYNYSLKVKDANGCESAVKNGNFTTTAPTMTFGTISVEATYNTTDCKYYVPTAAALTTAANDALTTTCGNAVTLSGFSTTPGSEITATSTITATATDMCGNTKSVSIEVTVPTIEFHAPATKTLELPYGSPTMNATTDMLGTPTYTPNDPSYTYESNVASLNPLGENSTGYNVTWTLKDACGNVLATDVQVVKVVLNCPTSATLDGYDYPVVRVGYDCWFKENVKATTSIEGAVAYNEEAANKDKFGLLYTWYAAMKAEPVSGSGSGSGGGPAPEMPAFFAFMASTSQGLCPDGWGIPTVTDFQNLFTYGGGNVAYLKHKDPTTWLPGKAGIDPSTGFNAPGAGYYNSALGRYEDLLDNVRYWTDSSVAPTSDKATCCEFNYYCNEPMFKVVSKLDKNSVRCIKKND